MHKFIVLLLIAVVAYKTECRIIRTTEGWFNAKDEDQPRSNLAEHLKEIPMYPGIESYNEIDVPRRIIDARERCPEGTQADGAGECVPVFG
uniref:Venom peptide Pp22a n=1 Tax=Pristhesancus plagipennis TaxID=1955184 RepID=A0A2K8JNU9_PRIPG|nr:venom peptide Pp22a [Pristhesancus plagipennis]